LVVCLGSSEIELLVMLYGFILPFLIFLFVEFNPFLFLISQSRKDLIQEKDSSFW